MSIKIDCKNQSIEDVMRDVKEKSESVIYGGWHVIVGKSNDPIIKFINLDNLNEDEQHELLGDLDIMITHLQLAVNSNFGVLPIIEAKIPTMRKLNLVKSLYNQVVNVLQKNMNNNETKSEDIKDKLVIIDCKDKDMIDILKNLSNALYGEVSNSSPNIEFKNLDSLWVDELKELNKQLDGLYTTIRNSISPLTTVDVSQKTWRLHRILDLQRQIIKECQRKENKAKKIEEEYSKMSTEELKNELKELEVVKDYCREWLQSYSGSRIHPTYKENIESILIEVNSKIDVINKILAYRELKNSTNATTKRNEKWKRYNHLEIEELEMILDALNVKCTLRKCELHKCEDGYESRAIQKTINDILENMKVIKDVLKYKKGE